MGNFNTLSIDEILEKEGLTNIKVLDTLKVNAISKHVAQKICNAFPSCGLEYKNLFIEIARLNMYSAKMPDDLAQAKYYYKNSSIYFNESVDFNNIDSFAIHECIHYLQSVKDSNGELSRLGLCHFSKSKKPGLALNEAAVQLLTTRCMNVDLDNVKYYGIELQTPSPSYYPLECALVNQMAFFTGIGTLFKSTLYSNNNFKNKFSTLTSKNTYYTIELNLDYLMELQDTLSELTLKFQQDISAKELEKVNMKMEKTKEKIVTVFMGIQKLIYTTYFNNYFKTLENRTDVELFKICLSKYKDLVCTRDSDTDFNEFYVDLISKANKKYDKFPEISVDLVPAKHNFLPTFFQKLKTLISGNVRKVEKYTNID